MRYLSNGVWKRAALVDAINRGDWDASKHFFGWLKPAEIRGRRTAEKNLFDTGNYDGNGNRIPIWKVGSDGRLQGQLKTITGDELLGRMSLPETLVPEKKSCDWDWEPFLKRMWAALKGD
jgi:lysozyme